MYAHFSQVGEIRDAVVAGNVDATRRPARWLATHQVGDEFPMPGAAAGLEQMRAEGRAILDQNGLAGVARSVGRLGASCGGCHTAVQAGPHFKVPEIPKMPAAGAAPDTHMNRHVWASEQLWEGLIGPSEGSWIVGAAALEGPALDFGPEGSSPRQAVALEARVAKLAKSARDAHTLAERATVYGQLLETCAECHELLGVRMSH